MLPESDSLECTVLEALGRVNRLTEVAPFVQRQPFNPWAIVSGSEKRLPTSRRGVLDFYATHPGKLLDRGWSTLRYGFRNRYLTVAWRKNP
jgi:hypothetical protein